MTTKAEEFRYWAERSHSKKAKKAGAAKAAKASRPAAAGSGVPGARKPSTRAGKKALYALEVVAPGARPSRKSTRKATNRQRTDAQMRVKLRTQEVSPSSRAALRTS